MKVAYYFRCKRTGNYSIENVFGPVISVLKQKLEIKTFYTQKPLDWKAIFKVSRIQADVHHITGAENYLAMGLPPERTILTVHDIGHFTNTLKGLRKFLYQIIYWKLPPIRSIRITTISEFTKQQLIEHFSLVPERITVIPNPLQVVFQRSDKVFQAEQPVILQIGGGKNKNIESLIEAIKGLNYKLLLVRSPDEGLLNLLAEQGIVHEFRYNLKEAEVWQAYVESDILFFASTYEGFGLPIIEAQAVGRPVITGNVTGMLEVLKVEGSACVVSPLDVNDIRTAVLKITNDATYRHSLIEKGFLNVTHYSADAIAQQYLDLYNQIVSGAQ